MCPPCLCLRSLPMVDTAVVHSLYISLTLNVSHLVSGAGLTIVIHECHISRRGCSCTGVQAVLPNLQKNLYKYIVSVYAPGRRARRRVARGHYFTLQYTRKLRATSTSSLCICVATTVPAVTAHKLPSCRERAELPTIVDTSAEICSSAQHNKCMCMWPAGPRSNATAGRGDAAEHRVAHNVKHSTRTTDAAALTEAQSTAQRH